MDALECMYRLKKYCPQMLTDGIRLKEKTGKICIHIIYVSLEKCYNIKIKREILELHHSYTILFVINNKRTDINILFSCCLYIYLFQAPIYEGRYVKNYPILCQAFVFYVNVCFFLVNFHNLWDYRTLMSIFFQCTFLLDRN